MLKRDVNFMMSNHWKEEETSTSQRPHIQPHCISLHLDSSLNLRKLCLIPRGGEMSEAGQDLNSGLSNFEHKTEVIVTYPLQLL